MRSLRCSRDQRKFPPFAFLVLISNDLLKLESTMLGDLDLVAIFLWNKALMFDEEADEIPRDLEPPIKIRVAELLVKHVHELTLSKLRSVCLPAAEQRITKLSINAGTEPSLLQIAEIPIKVRNSVFDGQFNFFGKNVEHGLAAQPSVMQISFIANASV